MAYGGASHQTDRDIVVFLPQQKVYHEYCALGVEWSSIDRQAKHPVFSGTRQTHGPNPLVMSRPLLNLHLSELWVCKRRKALQNPTRLLGMARAFKGIH